MDYGSHLHAPLTFKMVYSWKIINFQSRDQKENIHSLVKLGQTAFVKLGQIVPLKKKKKKKNLVKLHEGGCTVA